MSPINPTRVASRPAQEPLSLSELLAALSREFVAASASHHATLTYWKQVYENNPILSDYSPLGMKIVSAQLSVPVAVAQVTSKPKKVAQLTKSTIAKAIEGDFPKSKKQELAGAIYAHLAGKGKLSFSNANLLNDMDEAVKKCLPDGANPLNKQFLAELSRGFQAQPAVDSEISLLYRSKDLEQVKPELILRLNLDFKLE